MTSGLSEDSAFRAPTSRTRWLRIGFGVVLGVAALLLAARVDARPASRVFLNGVPTPVYFNDGDSFSVLGGAHEGSKARLSGFNSLESFGGVHRWGSWSAQELYVNSKMATLNGRRGVWHCYSDLKRDGYGRILWHCPDLALDNLRKGLAHAMTITAEPAAPELIEAQRLAQLEKRGMWAHGVPKYIVTSTHSNDEGYAGKTYNRLISTEDGHSEQWLHNDNYKECEEVCHPTGSCMVYVAFTRRYGPQRADCLQH